MTTREANKKNKQKHSGDARVKWVIKHEYCRMQTNTFWEKESINVFVVSKQWKKIDKADIQLLVTTNITINEI